MECGGNTPRRIILASQSPRRRELLNQAGFLYETEPSCQAERITKEQPWEVVLELSRQKAEDVYQNHISQEEDRGFSPVKKEAEQPILVIGADTIVAYGGRILGKPETPKAAQEMLEMLQGNVHQVYTGVTLVWNETADRREYSFYERTEVEFYPMTRQEISDYVSTNDCMDKAGAYGIQTHFGVYIKGIRGDYNNVVGLPIARLYQEMKSLGLEPERNLNLI